jgi:signal transduction histidine kinase
MVTPDAPGGVRFGAAEFDLVFPFHIAFGPDLALSGIGRSLRKLAPGLQTGQRFDAAFAPKRPADPFTWARLVEGAGRLYTIRECFTDVVLRGQFVPLGGQLYFLGAPWLANTDDLKHRGLKLDDFAVHDPTLDLLQVLQLRNMVADDLQALMGRLKQQAVQIAEAARAKDAFLAGISHELRTPLTGILGMAEILGENLHGRLNERQAGHVRIIHTSGLRLLTLINNVIDLAKIGAGQVELQREICPIDSFCALAFERARVVAQPRNQQVSFVNEAAGVRVAVDPRRMAEVLGHLLSNAAKFTPEGGEFGLRATADESDVRIEVWDRGIGIDPQNLPKLFQPFVQLDGRLTRRYDGTGVGLALVKQWVDLHGGRVEVESVSGSGSRFAVILARVGTEGARMA